MDIGPPPHMGAIGPPGPAQPPLLTSTAPETPLHRALETRLPESPSIEALTSSQLGKSRATPGDVASGWGAHFDIDIDILAMKLPDSPVWNTVASPSDDIFGRVPGRTGANEAIRDDGVELSPRPGDREVADSPVWATVVAPSDDIFEHVSDSTRGAKAAITDDGTTRSLERGESYDANYVALPEESVAPPPPPAHRMHCRICLSDTCDDLTATMCGHIFCYKCVTLACFERY